MYDSHAHLCFPEFDKDREQVVAQARKELTGVIVSSARHDEGLCVIDLVKKHPDFLFTSLGHHPTEGANPDKVLNLLEANSGSLVAVGEVGLDFHRVKDPAKREQQKQVFGKFISIAEKMRKPLVIHSWDAEQEAFDMIKDRNVAAAFHCYTGPKELAMQISEKFYVSISTNIMFSKKIRKAAKSVPLDRLLLETDSPFLDPDRERRRNVPGNIRLSAGKIAELRGISIEEVAKATEENTRKLFNLR